VCDFLFPRLADVVMSLSWQGRPLQSVRDVVQVIMNFRELRLKGGRLNSKFNGMEGQASRVCLFYLFLCNIELSDW